MDLVKKLSVFTSLTLSSVILEHYIFTNTSYKSNTNSSNNVNNESNNSSNLLHLLNNNDESKSRIFELLKMNEIIYGKTLINKKFIHLSNPYNLYIKDIYGLDDKVKYKHFENYDFNKLSDFFLNIHIFVN